MTRTSIYDAIVVGCGPAGNLASYRLATGGLRVLQIEKEELPRHKVCGGGISKKTLDLLPFKIDPVVETVMREGFVSFGSPMVIARELPDAGVMVCRDKFDNFLAQKAVQAGAELLQRCAFERFTKRENHILAVETNRGTFLTRTLIGADGVHSRVRAQMPGMRKPPALPAVEALLIPREGVLEELNGRCLFDFHAIDGGYGWIFPKKDHLNVGLYRFRKTPANIHLRQLLEHFIESNPLLARFRSIDVRGLVIPVRPAGRSLVSENVLLAGDAAGLAEAFFGEGISFAVKSGLLAAEAVEGHLRERRSLSLYNAKMRRLRVNNAFARGLAKVFYRAPHNVVGAIARRDAVNGYFAGLITGRYSAPACFFFSLAMAPLWIFSRQEKSMPLPGSG